MLLEHSVLSGIVSLSCLLLTYFTRNTKFFGGNILRTPWCCGEHQAVPFSSLAVGPMPQSSSWKQELSHLLLLVLCILRLGREREREKRGSSIFFV